MRLRSLAAHLGGALPLPPNTLRSIVRQRIMGMALANAVPFNQALGIEIIDVAEDRAAVRLPEDDRLLNHVGTLVDLRGAVVARMTVDWYVKAARD